MLDYLGNGRQRLMTNAYYWIPGIAFTLWVLVKRFSIDDRLLGAIGCLSKGLASFVYAYAPTEFLFYLGEYYAINYTILYPYRFIM